MTTTVQPAAPDLTTAGPATGESAIDQGVVESFVGRVLTDYAGASGAVMTVLGDRLGLYQAMTGAGCLSAGELAARTDLNPRLVAEWLGSQTVAGYVRHSAADGTFELPIEHAMALSIVTSPTYVVGAAEIVAGQYATLDALERAFRGDGAIEYSEFPDSVASGIERFFRTAYANQLAELWFPAIDDAVATLADGARVADVGCGHGVATILMAKQWPASVFTGFDLDEDSIAVARARAVDAGSLTNLEFCVANAAAIGPGPYEIVTFFDALHDLGNPVGALRRARELLTPGGRLIVVEPWSADRLDDGIGNPIARIDWSVSTSLCTPTSLAQQGAYGLGNQGGPAARLELFADAGFEDGRLVLDTGHNLILTASVA